MRSTRRRVERLEAEHCRTEGRMFTITKHHEQDNETALAQAGVETAPGDMVVFLLNFGDEARREPARLLAAG